MNVVSVALVVSVVVFGWAACYLLFKLIARSEELRREKEINYTLKMSSGSLLESLQTANAHIRELKDHIKVLKARKPTRNAWDNLN